VTPTEPIARLKFDLDRDTKTVGEALMKLIKLYFPAPGAEKPTLAEAKVAVDLISEGLFSGSKACGEVARLRKVLTTSRDLHQPRPHADPTKPGALCVACSLDGSVTAWPCRAWQALDTALMHDQP
jgi:hypothetical protein